MLEHKLLELISQEKVQEVAKIDAKSVSTDAKSYVKKNSLTYYIVINTWLMIVKNFAPHAWVRLASLITTKGLIIAINTLQDEALRVIKGEDLGPWARVFYADVRHGTPVVDRELFDSAIGIDDTATVLFLLRYPKRFSPLGNDVIQKKSITDFLQYENRTKLMQRSSSYGYVDVVKHVREYIANMYDWDAICAEIDQIDPAALPFSSGSAVNARATTGDKLSALATGEHEECFVDHFGVWMVDRPATKVPKPMPVKVLAVPKSYKASRIIAMDDVYNLTMGLAIEEIFRKADRAAGSKRQINLEDQTINQRLACAGSVDGTVATLDASHASDLISKSLFVDLFPSEYVRRVRHLLPSRYNVDGTVRDLQMASTSGNTLTFRHETIVYKGTVGASEDYFSRLVHNIERRAWAYGDDSTVNSEAYDVAVYFFTRLGLIINEDKSYASGSFRESCGKDYMDGMDVTSIYYPRFPVIGTIKGDRVNLSDGIFRDTYRGKIENSLTMLIDLQKKIFPYSYDAARFVASIVTHAAKVTYSVAGSVCTDLWDYVDGGVTRRVPAAYAVEKCGRYVHPRELNFHFIKVGVATDNLQGDQQALFLRCLALDTKHTVPMVTHKCSRDFTESEKAYYEYWKYTHFLRYGSTFDSELDRLLGIPSKPISISQFYGITRLELTLR